MTGIDDAFIGEPVVRARARAAPKTDADPEQPEPEAESQPSAVIFGSKTTGAPHVVGIVDDPRGRWLTCTCRAYLSIEIRPKGCWAMQRTRTLLDWPSEDETE